MAGPKVPGGELIVGQTLVALGQGMGLVSPSAEALSAFLETYGERLRASVESWGRIRLEVTENARQIGRIAAGYASAAGTTSVTRAQMRKALRVANASRGETWVLGPCPYCRES